MRQCDYNLIHGLTAYPSWFEGPVDALAGIAVTGVIAADAYQPISVGDNDKSCPNCQKK